MALPASKLPSTPVVAQRTTTNKSPAVSCSVTSSHQSLHRRICRHYLKYQTHGYWTEVGPSPRRGSLRCLCQIGIAPCRSYLVCHTTRDCKTGPRENITHSGRRPVIASECRGDEESGHPSCPTKVVSSRQGLAEACKYVYNDVKFVNERARNDIVLLSRGILSLDARARQDLAFLGSEFLKLDARAREDTEKMMDHNMKEKAERLQYITALLKEKARSRLSTAADQHWSDGALEADLRWADHHAKQRAMEDMVMALEFLKNIHDRMVSNTYKFPLGRESGPPSASVVLEKNGKNLDFLSKEVSSDCIAAIQEAYLSMASALSIADGIDYTDPEELELLISTLIDLDAMDGKSSVTLLAECSSSPDVNTRQALANALASAPSMWTLGNAGMGALQRLAEDSNPAVASAASRAIRELKKQWEIEEGDSFSFMMTQDPQQNEDDQDGDGGELI